MRGLPQKDAYETVLRDALVADSLLPMGIYLGTRSGQLFVSRDEGKTWERIIEGLPPVLCIRNSFIQDTTFGSAEISPSDTAPRLLVPARQILPQQIGRQIASQEKLSMPVTIHLPGALREFAGWAAQRGNS